MTVPFHRATLLLAFPLAACSSASITPSGVTGTATAVGSVGGVTLAVADAIAGTYTATVPNESGSGSTAIWTVGIDVSSLSGECAYENAHLGVPRSNEVKLHLTLFGLNAPPAPGTYAMTSDSTAGEPTMNFEFLANFSSDGPTCTTMRTDATDGTVTLASSNGGTYAGSYSLTFGADILTGSFSAPTCAIADPDGDPNGGAMCL